MGDGGWQSVIRFWFDECEPAQYWQKAPAFDRQVATRFGQLHDAACRCELFGWRHHDLGRLAEILLLDQFSRNIYRDRAAAFVSDPLALALAQEAVALGVAARLTVQQRCFLYMPYMHSESALIHRQALKLFAEPGLEDNLAFEQRHKSIIDRFGRYPHRNAVLGRPSTPEEQAFLKQPGSSF